MHVNVMAPDEEIAEDMVNHIGIEDLINGNVDGADDVVMCAPLREEIIVFSSHGVNQSSAI